MNFLVTLSGTPISPSVSGGRDACACPPTPKLCWCPSPHDSPHFRGGRWHQVGPQVQDCPIQKQKFRKSRGIDDEQSPGVPPSLPSPQFTVTCCFGPDVPSAARGAPPVCVRRCRDTKPPVSGTLAQPWEARGQKGSQRFLKMKAWRGQRWCVRVHLCASVCTPACADFDR